MKLKHAIGASILGLFVSATASAEETRERTEVIEVEVEFEEEKNEWWDDVRPVVSLRGGLDYAKVGGKTSDVQLFPNADPSQYIPTSKWDTAGLWGAFLGVEIPVFEEEDGMRWQTGVSYYGTSDFEVDGEILEGGDDEVPDYLLKQYEYKVRNTRVMWENKFLTAINYWFDLYFLGGIGWSQNKAFDYKERTTVPRDFINPPFEDKTSNSFTYSFGFGMEAAVTNHIRVGLGYQYSDLGKVALDKSDGQETDESIDVNRSPAQELVANISYIF